MSEYRLIVNQNPSYPANLFSIDGGTTWLDQINDSFSEGTYRLQVKSSVYSEEMEQTVYFWGWTDGYKGFDRTISLYQAVSLTATVSTTPKPVNKIVLGGSDQTEKQRVLLDLSTDTLSTADYLPTDTTAHNNKGEKLTGTATIYPTGNYDISTKSQQQIFYGPGYVSNDGSITVQIAADEQSKIISDNIKSGINILGVDGTFTSDATLNSNHLLPNGIIAYGSSNTKYTGDASTITDPQVAIISTKSGTAGLYGGINGNYIYPGASYVVSIASAEQSKIIPANIKGGITILGVTGTCSYAVESTTEPESGTSEYQYTIVTDSSSDEEEINNLSLEEDEEENTSSEEELTAEELDAIAQRERNRLAYEQATYTEEESDE